MLYLVPSPMEIYTGFPRDKYDPMGYYGKRRGISFCQYRLKEKAIGIARGIPWDHICPMGYSMGSHDSPMRHPTGFPVGSDGITLALLNIPWGSLESHGMYHGALHRLTTLYD